MDTKTRSVIVALALLAAAELGLRWMERAPEGRLPADRPVVIVLGTSRSRAGLSPEVIARALFVKGIHDPWVANASLEASTSVGLYETYMSQIHPFAGGAGGTGSGEGEPVVIAIEVRGSGLNDSYMSAEESEYAERFRLEDGDLREVGFLELFADGRFAPASRSLLGRLRIAHGVDTIRPRVAALWSDDEDSDGHLDHGPLTGSDAPWAAGTRGWVPYPDVQEPNLREGMWRTHYQTVLLMDFELGGVQTDFLRLLVRRIRADGFRPVLYCMPVTEIQRGFYAPGDYARYLRHVGEVAAEEGVPFVDFDSTLGVPLEAFTDTHHLRVSAVPLMSRELAERALLPLFLE